MQVHANQPRAALLTSRCDGVFSYNWIVCEREPGKYVRRVADELAQAAATLVEHRAEYVNCAELETMHESLCEGDYPEGGWDFDDVIQAVKKAPELAVTEYQQTGSPSIQESLWYANLFGFLNDIFPGNDGVWVNFDGPLGPFLCELLRFEAEKYEAIDQLTNVRAVWLGKVAVLSSLSWGGDVSSDQWHAFHTAVKEWDKGHGNAEGRTRNPSPFAGRWFLVSIGGQRVDSLHEPLYIDFGKDNNGDFHFGQVKGTIDYREVQQEGQSVAEFSWEGSADADDVHGRGRAVLEGDELHGWLFFHQGEEADFVARKA